MSTVGQALGGLVGGIAGFFLGGPMGALRGAQIGIMAGGYLDPPKGPQIQGPRLDDLSVQTSTYGAFIPRGYGTFPVTGNVFWLENNRLKEKKKTQKAGGKGGGGGATTTTYSYYATFAVGLLDCSDGQPIQGVRRIWIEGRKWYDAGTDDVDEIRASNINATKFSVYTGAEDPVDVAWFDTSTRKESIDTHSQPVRLFGDPTLEFGTSDLALDVQRVVLERERSLRVSRQLYFEPLHSSIE